MLKIIKKPLLFLISLLFAIIPCISVNTTYTAKADTTTNYYDTSSVKTDLTSNLSSMFNTSVLNNLTSDIKFITFLEYGIGTEDYSLYAYICKTSSLEIDTSSEKNKLQFGVCSCETDIKNVTYAKYSLTFINNDTVLGFDCYKFKITGFSLPNTYTSSTPRYYCISGIEILTTGETNATEYEVGSIYLCTTSNENTTIERKGLTTISVDVYHTFYRSTYSDKGTGWANQLSSCYFALPKTFSLSNSSNYGNLTGVNAEFTSYFTNPILIVNNEDVYNDYHANALGCSLEYVDDNLWFEYVEKIWDSDVDSNVYNYYLSYNLRSENYKLPYYFTNRRTIEELNWLFLDSGANFNSENYCFSGDNLENYYLEYIHNLTVSGASHAFEYLFTSSSYFSNYSLCGLDYGDNNVHYILEENTNTYDDNSTISKFSLKEDNSSWLQRLFGISSSETKTLAPIVKVNVSDMSKTTEEISQLYYIDKSDVEEFRTFVNSNTSKDVYIFRYDCCEYFGQQVDVYDKNISNNAYSGLCCQEMVYLDFDILSFDFTQDGVTSTIPVVHSPEDVFNDLTPAPNTISSCSYTSIMPLLSLLLMLAFVFTIYLVITKIINFFKK